MPLLGPSWIAAVAVLLLVAACGPAPPTGSAGSQGPVATSPASGATEPGTPEPTASPALPAIAALRFRCSTFAFGVDVLTDAPHQDQDAPTPEAAALRAELAGSGDTLPARGWRLVGSDATHADFVAIDADGNLVVIALRRAGGAWTLDLEGSCYAAVVLAEGIGPASWAWGSPGVPGPTTQAFQALVTERACASGRSAQGRVVGPVVIAAAEMVLVFFGVRPLPGGQDCPSNPPTPVAVDLGQPLGNRLLRDGGHLPFGDPLHPQP